MNSPLKGEWVYSSFEEPLASKVSSTSLSWTTLRDATLPELLSLGFSEEEAHALWRSFDFWADRSTHSVCLCPILPEPAEYVELEHLGLSQRVLLHLKALRYLSEIAFLPRTELNLKTVDLLEVEMALARFIDDFRSGAIILKEVN